MFEKNNPSPLVPAAAAAAAAGRPAAAAAAEVRTEHCPAAPVDHRTKQNAGCFHAQIERRGRPDQTSVVEVFINARVQCNTPTEACFSAGPRIDKTKLTRNR